MKSGFTFELYNMIFKNCFIHKTRYANGNLQLSLFGTDPDINETAHFADITLDQNKTKLSENEIVVDCRFRPTLIPQLLKLGILKEQTGTCVKNSMFYPIYTINDTNVKEKEYSMPELIAA